jgi:hypothetical protein
MHKRKSFEHEQELRAAVWIVESGKYPLALQDPQNPSANPFCETPGLYVPVDVERLVERIYVAPTAEAWQVDLIRALTRRFELSKEVVQSELSESPV